jgi:TonB family protein
MTAAATGPSSANLFSTFSGEGNGLYRTRCEAFACSLLGQALIVGLLTYFTSCVMQSPPPGVRLQFPNLDDLPLVFSGHNGGGGGGRDALPASHGNLPRASLDTQIVSPTVIVPKEMPRLPVEETVMVASDIKLPQGGQIGDPFSRFSTLSNGPGGPGGIGTGCCGGIGPASGPFVGSGPPGIFPAGKQGVTVPQVIYNPEPGFSDEARQAKMQGIVILLVVVGKDGRTYNIRVGQSLGLGLDKKAIEAVSRWRFKPATLNGQPVATRIAVEVDFHLY